MTTLQPAAVAYPQIATIVPGNGAMRQPGAGGRNGPTQVEQPADWIANGHYGPHRPSPESIIKHIKTSSESRDDLGINAHVVFDVAQYASLPENRRRLALVTLLHLSFHAKDPQGTLGATHRALFFAEKEAAQKRADPGFLARAEAVFLARAGEALL